MMGVVEFVVLFLAQYSVLSKYFPFLSIQCRNYGTCHRDKKKKKKGSYVPNVFVIAGHSGPCDLGLTPAVVGVFCNDQI